MNLLRIGILGSLLIFFIAVLRFFLIDKLPKATFFVLWEIAALRLLMPFSISLPFSMLPVPTIGSGITTTVSNLTKTQALGTLPIPADSALIEQPGVQPSFLVLLWGVGTVVLGTWFFILYLHNTQKFKASLPNKTPIVQTWLAEHSIIRSLEVRVSDQITSPLTYGIFHPVILLPKGMDPSDETALHVVLTHEYIHIRRFDAIAKLLFAAALCLHWWNPLVWVMYVLANRDMELSCDASVIQALGAEHRSTYALTLISMEEDRSPCVPFQSHFSKNAITERIEAIMKFKKSSVAAIILAVILVLAAVFFLTTGPRSTTTCSEQEAADQLEKSIRYENGMITFTIPTSYEKPENWNIHVAGRQVFPDGMSMSFHQFEVINESHTWEPGKEYTIQIADQYFTLLAMDIFFPNDIHNSIDLLAKASADSE